MTGEISRSGFIRKPFIDSDVITAVEKALDRELSVHQALDREG